MVEVQNITVPVIALIDEVQEYLHHGVQELAGQVLGIRPEAQREYILVSLPGDVEVLLLQELAC